MENIKEMLVDDILDENYLPYAMSVIIDRALPEIDGFKPSHRKLLYTMYKMGVRDKKTKSANIVGQTMQLNPHGDGAIYGAMVRLTENHGALLAPLVSSKGNFGKVYSRDMAFAAARYTEAGLAPISELLFEGINEDTVDFIPNYDNTTTEPRLLPTKFPNILVNNSMGIAVSMASSFCGFNLTETCEAVITYLKGEDLPILIPDLTTGGFIINDESAIQEINQVGRGSVILRGKASISSDRKSIEITEIPFSTSIEQILESIIDQVKSGKLKDIVDARDMSDINGLRILIELSRGADPHKILSQLYQKTPLQSSLSCNFNILINGKPRILGVQAILSEWVKFRKDCIVRKTEFHLKALSDKRHLYEGLALAISDMSRAIGIIRRSETDVVAIKELQDSFGMSQRQAEYVIDTKLRSLSKTSIQTLADKISTINKEIEQLTELISSDENLSSYIIKEQEDIIQKYGKPRNTQLLDPSVLEDVEKFEEYPVSICVTEQGYIKKIKEEGKVNGKQKLKDGDEIKTTFSCMNSSTLLFFTEDCSVFRINAYSIPDSTSAQFGQYIPNIVDSESPIIHVSCISEKRDLVVIYENGYGQRIPTSLYQYSDRKQIIKLLNAFKSSEGKVMYIDTITVADENSYLQMQTRNKNLLLTSIVQFSSIPPATTKARRIRICKVPVDCLLKSVKRIEKFNFIYTKCVAAKCPGKMLHVLKGGI